MNWNILVISTAAVIMFVSACYTVTNIVHTVAVFSGG